VGSRGDCTWVLGLAGFRVVTLERGGEAADSRMTIRIERRGARRYPCSGCGRRTARVRSARDRTWDDVPWAAHPVTLVYAQRRVRCRHCGIRTEQVDFADAKARVTRRLRQQIGVDCQSMPTSHAAVRHGVSWGKARRAEHAFLREWDAQRPRRRPRYLGADEIHRGKKHKFYTVLSDLVHGEVIGLAKDRTEESVAGLLTTCLNARQRGAVEAVCTDMHRPYVNAVAHQLPTAEVVFDKFHVLQHAGAALDAVRRQEFFRAGAVMRAFGRGKRWLLLRRWKTVRGSKRGELQQLFAANRRLFKAYVLREQLDRLWTYKTRDGVAQFLFGWLKAVTPWSITSMASLRTATIRSASVSSNP
jgi:transposase